MIEVCMLTRPWFKSLRRYNRDLAPGASGFEGGHHCREGFVHVADHLLHGPRVLKRTNTRSLLRTRPPAVRVVAVDGIDAVQIGAKIGEEKDEKEDEALDRLEEDELGQHLARRHVHHLGREDGPQLEERAAPRLPQLEGSCFPLQLRCHRRVAAAHRRIRLVGKAHSWPGVHETFACGHCKAAHQVVDASAHQAIDASGAR
eukprot:7386698-Prymnesium_polylepis.1